MKNTTKRFASIFTRVLVAAALCASSVGAMAGLVADISSSVQSSPASVAVGSNVSLIARASNAGPSNAPAVTLQVSLPNGALGNRFVYQSASGAGWTCSFNGTSNQVNCVLSDLAANATSTPVTILARTPTVAGIYATTSFATSQAGDNNPGNNASSTDTQVIAQPNADLGVSLSAPATAELGENINGQAQISNAGPGDAPSHEVRITVPTFFTNVTVTGGGYSCNGAAGILTCISSANFPAGTSRTISFSGRASTGGSGTFQAEIRNCGCTDTNIANNSSARPVTVFATAPAVQLSKTASAATVAVGAEFFFTVSARNNDSRPAQGVVVSDVLPSTATFLGTTVNGGFVCSGATTLSCTIPGALAPGASASVVIRMRAPTSNATISNTAQLLIGDYGLVGSATASINAVQPSFVDLSASKTASVAEVRRGQRMSFDLGVANAVGAESATGVRIVDTLPDGFTFESATGANWSCNGATTVTCGYGVTLGGGASSVVTILVRVADTALLGARTNAIRVSALENEVNQANNSATAQVNVVSDTVVSSDVSASAQFSVASARADDRLTLTLSLGSVGAGPVPAGASITGVLPTELSASTPPAGCQAAGQTLTCTSAAAIPTPGSVSFVVPISVASNLSGLPRSVTASFSASASGVDSNSTNNVAQATLRLEAGVAPPPPSNADIGVSLSPASSNVVAGGTAVLNATVSNAGPAIATAVRLNIALPAGFSAGSSTGALQCAAGSPLVCTAASLAVNASAAVTINLVASTVAGSFTVTGSVTAATTDSAQGNNQASAQVTVQTGGGTGDLANTLTPLVDDPIAQAAVQPIATGCARADFSLRDVCTALADAARRGDRTGVEETLRAIAPEEILVQARAVNEIGIAQFQNVDARMSELRGGGGGFSASNLTFISGDQVIPVGMLAGLVAASAADPDQDATTTEGLVSPWGFFINGVIQRGSRDPSQLESGFDFNTHAITLGVDYRFSDKLAAGAAIGSSKFSSDYSAGGSLDTRALTFTGYASYYYSDTGYVDSRLSYGNADFDQTRNINIRLGSLAENRVAVGSTDAGQLTAAFATGRHFQIDRISITPNVSLRYTRTNIDGFTESGADRFGLVFADQTIDALTFSGGVSASRPISTARGVFTPQFDLNLHHEFKNDGMAVEAQLIGQRPDEIFFLRGDAPDRDYASAGLGLVWVGAQGRQAYLTWRTLFGLERTERNTINVGARFEF